MATQIAERWWEKSSPHTYLEALRASGIGIYAAANWDEAATKYGAFFTLNNLPHTKLVVGPAGHCAWTAVRDQTGFDIVVEELRFFDHWLKGIDNQVMSEEKVHYYTYNADPTHSWRSAPSWPLPDEQKTALYLGARTLASAQPTEAAARDEVTLRYDDAAGSRLTYETEPLPADLTVTGHPTVELWTSSTAADGDYIATVYDVAPDGSATTFNIHGRLRASLRKEAPPPYDNLSLPYHPSRTATCSRSSRASPRCCASTCCRSRSCSAPAIGCGWC